MTLMITINMVGGVYDVCCISDQMGRQQLLSSGTRSPYCLPKKMNFTAASQFEFKRAKYIFVVLLLLLIAMMSLQIHYIWTTSIMVIYLRPNLKSGRLYQHC